MKVAQCGSLESNDCLITVTPDDETSIDIHSTVGLRFKDAIHQTITAVLKEQKQVCKVHIVDQGAYDYTIKARLQTALRRMNDE